jgi:hypothetical protein
MTEHEPGRPGPGRRDTMSALAARARGRSRMRMATLMAGAASLVTAGVVAANLPGPAHSKVASSATTPASSPSSAPVVTSTGDDGSGDDGGTHATTSRKPATATPATPKPAARTTHVTSGGS